MVAWASWTRRDSSSCAANTMKIVIVYNSRSGSKFTARTLQEICAKHGVEVEKCISVNDLLDSTVQPYIDKGAVIAVVGGDGTVSSMAGKVLGTKAALAPLPGGTLNHFTKDLGIAQDMDEAIASLRVARKHAVDVGVVNGTVFINNSSIGLYPSSLRLRNRFEKYLGKWLAAVIASIRAFARFRTYSVTIDSETFRTPFVFIGNNIYALDGALGANRTALDEGVLSVFIARTTSRFVLFKIALFALVGKARVLDEFDERRTTELTIKSKRRRMSVSRDGEVKRVKSPLTYEIRKGSLNVLF